MKGVIPDCLAKLIIEKKGKEVWQEILEKAGLGSGSRFLPTQDIDDDKVMKIVGSACAVMEKTLQEVADAFGVYWVKYYAPKLYGAYYGNAATAREFLLNLDYVHQQATKNIENARPPRFEYEKPDEKTLIMIYKSKRDLIVFFIGLLKGVGKYFNEELLITKIGPDKVKIVFP